MSSGRPFGPSSYTVSVLTVMMSILPKATSESFVSMCGTVCILHGFVLIRPKRRYDL